MLFINASEGFVKGKRQNQLTQAHIDDIVGTYQTREPRNGYSKRVTLEEIAANEYNLNISRYVSTAKADAEIDLVKTHADLVTIADEIHKATAKHNEFLIELGLPPLP